MLTTREIEQLNEIQAQSLASELAIEMMGMTAFKKELAEVLGYSYEGLKGWFRPGNRPNTMAILYMQAELERRRYEAAFKGMAEAMDRASRA